MSTPTILGSKPLTVGSLYTWQITLTKDAATWDLSAQTVTFFWTRPDGGVVQQTAIGDASGVCTYTDSGTGVLSTPGTTWKFSAYVLGYGFTVPVTFTVMRASGK